MPNQSSDIEAACRDAAAREASAGTASARELSLVELVQNVRAQQRASWERGEPVLVEQILASHPEIAADPDSVLDLVYHEYLLRECCGKPPDLDEFTERFSQHAAALKLQVAFHRAVQSAAQDAEHATHDECRQTVAHPAAPESDSPAPAIPGYEMLEEVGFGGMGVVYRARQIETNRIVAIKILSAGAHAGSRGRAQFRAEAKLIARLQHPHIVQIYGAGEKLGCPFLVLEYLGGGTLRDRLREAPQSPRAAAKVIARVARGLEAAHLAGVVHRDLTPGNILLASATSSAARGADLTNEIPKISDFGLAKSFVPHETQGEGGRTMTGDVLGTPAYMSPEQATGRTREIGPATDIYAAGAILYELLTGRPPFRGVTTVETLQLIVAAEPVSLSRLQPTLPRDLETLCLKCLEKEPARRYASAAELADDLERYLAGEPIRARRVNRLVTLARWCRRKPLVASLVSSIVLLVVLIVGGSLAALLRLEQAARERHAETKLAEARVHRLEQQLGRGERSLAALGEAAAIRAGPDVRDEAIASLALFDLEFARFGPSSATSSLLLDFDPRLQRYAQTDETGDVVVRALSDGREQCRIPCPARGRGNEPRVSAALFSPDGRHLVCRRPNDAQVEIWFVGNSQPRLVCSDQCDLLWGTGAVGFSADGRQLAVGQRSGLIRIYDLEAARPSLEMRVVGPIRHVAMHPSKPQVAIATEGPLEIRDLCDGKLLVQLDEAAGTEFLAWHPRGTILATSDRNGGISLWEPDRLRRRAVLAGHAVGGVAVAFNHAGTLLFSTAWDGSLRVWDPHWGQPLFTTIGSREYFLRFSPDDRLWAGDMVDGKVRIWRSPQQPAYRRLTPEATFDLGYYRMAAISPAGSGAGRLLAVAMQFGVGFWDVPSGRPIGSLPIGETLDLAFDASGNLLTADASGVRFWPVGESTGSAHALPIGPPERLGSPGTYSQMTASRDGQVIGLARRDEGGVVFHRQGPSMRVALPVHADVRSIALSPDGALAATGSHTRGLVRIADARSGTLVRDLPLGNSRVAFSPDGTKLLTTAEGLELWSVGDWQPLWKGAGTFLSAHAFSPDGKLVAVDSGTGRIILYAANDGRVVAQLDHPNQSVLHALAFGPEGRRLVGISRDLYQLFEWDLGLVRQKLAELAIPSELPECIGAGSSPDRPLALQVRLDDPGERLLQDLATQQSALRDKPQDTGLQLQVGRALSRLGRDREAREAFAAALANGGGLVAALELAACAARLQRWHEAVTILEAALARPALSPAQSAVLCNNLGWYLSLAPAELRDPPRALACARRALGTEPGNLNYVNTLGLALYRQGDAPLAIETLTFSRRGSASSASDLYVLALCCQSLGEVRRAAGLASRADYLAERHGPDLGPQDRLELALLRDEFLRGGSAATEGQ